VSLPALPRVEVHRRARLFSERARVSRDVLERVRAGEVVEARELEAVAEDLDEAVELLRQAL
jgi:predicted transcriptional regulator